MTEPGLEWINGAACTGSPTEMWHVVNPDANSDIRAARQRKGSLARSRWEDRWAPARQICESCPVMHECREYAISGREEWSMWGGLDPDQLRAEQRRRKRGRRRSSRTS